MAALWHIQPGSKEVLTSRGFFLLISFEDFKQNVKKQIEEHNKRNNFKKIEKKGETFSRI
jgi:hypothetical protein